MILRYVPEYIIKHDYRAAKRIILSSMGAVLFFGIFISILSAILSKIWPNFINRFFLAGYLFLVSLLGILRAEVGICEAAFGSFLKQGYKILFEVLGTILKLILFISSLKFGFGLFGIVISIGLVDIFLIIIYFLRINFLLSKQGPGLNRIELERKRIIKFSFKEYIAKLLSFFWYTKIDAYIINFFLGAASTGIFYFVVTIVSMLTDYMPGSVMQPISQAIFSRQYAKYESQRELCYLFKLNNKLNAFFVFPVFIVFPLVIDKILIIFFKKYLVSLFLFPILLFFMAFYIFSMPVRNIVIALEKNEITIFSGAVIFYKIPMAIFLTKNFGLSGAAFAVGSSLFVYFLIQLLLTRRLIKIRYPWLSFFKILMNSLIAALAILLIRPLITNIFTLILALFLAFIVYLVSSFFNKAFEEYDRNLLNKAFKKPVWIF